jgi:hypothetical protein
MAIDSFPSEQNAGKNLHFTLKCANISGCVATLLLSYAHIIAAESILIQIHPHNARWSSR